MPFDKTRAKRNAEKFVAQGKIKQAIAEYRSVVEHDARDIATTNMLGDLLAKNGEKASAVESYTKVGEHYAAQGFASKAIAIYNKISKLQPDSLEVCEKLAELYAMKGALSEARAHYTKLAEAYTKKGRRLDALAVWKQIADLDPNNTEVCVTVAEMYLREGQNEEAMEAFTDAGARLARKGKHEEAVKHLTKAVELKPGELRVLSALVASYSAMSQHNKAINLLDEILEDEPYNRDVLYMLVECQIDSGNNAGAEKAVIRLVEIEPANYPKLLDLLAMYLASNEVDSAARILLMSAEYLLAAGDGVECKKWIDAVLERSEYHVATLRLLARHATWQRDEEAFRVALERLADAASRAGDVEEERYAVAHLAVIRPHEAQYAERLAAINETHGFSAAIVDEELLKAQFVEDSETVEVSEKAAAEPVIAQPPADIERNGHVEEAPIALDAPADEKLEKELESIAFYVENGYAELAGKALAELEAEFGERPEISELRNKLSGDYQSSPAAKSASRGLDDLRSEFGVGDAEPAGDEDFETSFQTAVAYQEMGLLEQAISEFQDAISLVNPDDGTRRFFHCSNLLGHCFLSNGTPKHAVTWFNRALGTPGLSAEEKQGLWYELGIALEAAEEFDAAAKYFEQVYAENVDFRDVAQRVKTMLVVH